VLLLSLGAWRRGRLWLLPLAPLSLALAYYAHGTLLVLPSQRFLVLVNAERFVHYSLLCALVLLPWVERWQAVLAIWLLWIGLVAMPSMRLTPSLVLDPPLSLSRADMALFAAVRERTPPSATIFSLVRDFSLPAFTGRAQNAVEPLDWSMGGLPPGEVEVRWKEMMGFGGLAPAERRRLLAERDYTHLLLRKPSRAVTGNSVLQRLLPEGAAHTIYEDDAYLLFALGR
jgi:hypothetical protein